MSSCLEGVLTINPNWDSSELIITESPSGTLAINVAEGTILQEDSAITIAEVSPNSSPIIFEWTIDEIFAPLALGIQFSGTGILGDGIYNLYYITTGYIVLHGAVVAGVPEVVAGDTVTMLLDFANDEGGFLLNGSRVY